MAWTSADDAALAWSNRQEQLRREGKLKPYSPKLPTKPLALAWKINKKGDWILVINKDAVLPNIYGTISKTTDGYKATFLTSRTGPYAKYETRLSYYKDLVFRTLAEAKKFLENENKDMPMRVMKNNSVLYKKWI
jgi:hypothetical protein